MLLLHLITTIALKIDLYMRHVERRIHEEEERLNYYLEYSTSRKLMPVVDQCFILAHVDTIISKGDKTQDLVVNPGDLLLKF